MEVEEEKLAVDPKEILKQKGNKDLLKIVEDQLEAAVTASRADTDEILKSVEKKFAEFF